MRDGTDPVPNSHMAYITSQTVKNLPCRGDQIHQRKKQEGSETEQETSQMVFNRHVIPNQQ